MTEQAARSETEKTPGDRALGEPVQWAAMRHGELFRAVHDNNEPGRAHARGRQWTELAGEVEEASSALQDAVRGSKAGWRGEAAEAARTALTELVRHGEEIARTMRGVGQQVGQQASVMEWAKAEMPEPSNFDPGAFVRENYTGGDLNGLAVMNAVAIAAAAKDADSKHDHAVHVMTEMEKASREIDEKTPAFHPDDITFRGKREARPASEASPGAAGPQHQEKRQRQVEDEQAEPAGAPGPQAQATQRMTAVGPNQPAGVHAMSAPSTAGPLPSAAPQSAPPPPAPPTPPNVPGDVPAPGSGPAGGSGAAAETRKLRPVNSGPDKPSAPKAPDSNAATHKLRALSYEPPTTQAPNPPDQKPGGPNPPASTTSASTNNTPPPRFTPPSGLPQGEQRHVNQFQQPQGSWTPSFRGDLPSRSDKPGSGPGSGAGAGGRPPGGGVPGPAGPSAFRSSGGGAGGAPSLDSPAGSSGGSGARLSPGGTSSAAPAAGGSSGTAGGGANGGGSGNAGAMGAAPMGGMAGGAGARQGGSEDKEHQSRGYLKDQNPFQVNDRPAPPVIGVKFKKKRPTGKDDSGDADG